MARGQKHYTEKFKNTIVDLYNTEKSLVKLRNEYDVSKSAISGQVKKGNTVLTDKTRERHYKHL